jgi:hypothetical protein
MCDCCNNKAISLTILHMETGFIPKDLLYGELAADARTTGRSATSSSAHGKAWLTTAPLDAKQSGRAQQVQKQQETRLLSTSD